MDDVSVACRRRGGEVRVSVSDIAMCVVVDGCEVLRRLLVAAGVGVVGCGHIPFAIGGWWGACFGVSGVLPFLPCKPFERCDWSPFAADTCSGSYVQSSHLLWRLPISRHTNYADFEICFHGLCHS